MKKVYIFLSSGISPAAFYLAHYRESRNEGDLVICADGGYRIARGLGLFPDLVIGDLDSLERDKVEGEVLKYPAEKDFSDFELALLKAGEFLPDSVIVYGALGGRKDHEITNILVLAFSLIPLVFIEEEVEIFNVIHTLRLEGKKGSICSLLPFGGPCFVEEVRGFRYPLRQEELLPSSRGLSNIILENEAQVSIKRGNLVVVVVKKG
ncbi:MAG: hypothetical protein AMS17_03775 [Spirochaetes bacterium DG_61]|jgi:thiamine pyrophosphokinase|nr:MAG: hypothetical protein AMS17_03775 [Spirochaetes bacterium DG_61]